MSRAILGKYSHCPEKKPFIIFLKSSLIGYPVIYLANLPVCQRFKVEKIP